jgi:hypothetical protein
MGHRAFAEFAGILDCERMGRAAMQFLNRSRDQPAGLIEMVNGRFGLKHFVCTSYVQGNSKPVLTRCQ